MKEYNRSGGTYDGYYTMCRECSRIKSAEYRAANREMINAREREYQRKKKEEDKSAYSEKKHQYYLRKKAKTTPEEREKRYRYGREWYLQNTFGITGDQYSEMLSLQGGVCAICGEGPKRKCDKHLVVDHDHDTGRVRKLLCHQCNSALGMMEEREDIALRMVNYIRSECIG